MNIIPREDDSIILVEKANIVICAVQKENFDIEEIFAFDSQEKKDILKAYVVFDIVQQKIIETYNVEKEDFGTIVYYWLSNQKDETGNGLELCHIIPDDSPTPKLHLKIILCVSILLVGVFLFFRSLNNVKNTSITSELIISDKLQTKGYLAFSPSDSLIKVKMYVSSNVNAKSDEIDWGKVSLHIMPKDTLYPKRNCRIFLHAYTLKTPSDIKDFTFDFNINDYVQYVILNMKKEDYLTHTALNFFMDVEKKNIIFDFDNGRYQKCETADDINDFLVPYFEEGKGSIKIDTVAFYPYDKPIKGPTIFSKEYPSIKYIRLK